jgi:hypothetical protein
VKVGDKFTTNSTRHQGATQSRFLITSPITRRSLLDHGLYVRDVIGIGPGRDPTVGTVDTIVDAPMEISCVRYLEFEFGF